MHGRMAGRGRIVLTVVVDDVTVTVGEYKVVVAGMVEVAVVVVSVRVVDVTVTTGEYIVVDTPTFVVVGTLTVGENEVMF